ncbi:hypothetical protein CTAYLR_006139 [Chrysophaeum taylorii]|uniref:Uncharacterized protein n=1 Tax=Chrysophaeum taylorii TaxID=2483200 RepID=A0AAD7XN97_9STRA|nr:hypothetical protein CTAYLR_006139 [Chrysophaeum taylorii]
MESQQAPARVTSAPQPSTFFRSEANWPLRFPIHITFPDNFPMLREKLVSLQANEQGLYIYRFGFCDFDSQADANFASAKLKHLCDSLSAAVGRNDQPLMQALRERLEEHLCYWKVQPSIDLPPSPPPRPKPTTVRSGRWSEDEHKLFLSLMTQYGRSWTQIAEKMPTRNEPQVRSHAQKYFMKLNAERDEARLKPARKRTRVDQCDYDYGPVAATADAHFIPTPAPHGYYVPAKDSRHLPVMAPAPLMTLPGALLYPPSSIPEEPVQEPTTTAVAAQDDALHDDEEEDS